MKALTVYKASAGSGKTFRLAVEYIKLLIDNPVSFRGILAVTFTNKATEEMKLRILSQLYGIWKKLPESDSYIKEVCRDLDISENTAGRKAGMALNHLIHNYHYFRVETIDSFFQSILRNLARELDLTANLKIGLNDVQVEEQAVDQLIESLDTTSEMLKWLINYIFSNINENKSWNVIGQIKNFGRTIFSDKYKTAGDSLTKAVSMPGFFDDYVRQIRSIRNSAAARMAKYADEFEAETERAGLTVTSYSGGKNGIGSYFNKIKGKDFSDSKCKNMTLERCLADSANWAAKSSPNRNVIIALADSKLMKLLHDAEKDRPGQWKLYVSADCTLRHLDKLRLLNAIEVMVRRLNDEADRFLLSDTQYLLHALIKDNDSPFIFEKAGCQLEHIMIDEFQDTSVVQWKNFKVLLTECMSRGTDNDAVVRNLIVGDVKQSIYRWRSGDWRLLNNIEQQFACPETSIDIKTLQTNFRSEKNLIEFNNKFFELAASREYEKELEVNDQAIANEIITAYGDVCQKPRDGIGQGGLVRITLLPADNYATNMLTHIKATLQELVAAGVSANRIAIIIRYNRHIPFIADYLAEECPGIKLVSDDAFRFDASFAVNIIILAVRLLAHPEDITAKAALAVTYRKKILGFDDVDSTLSSMAGERLDSLLPAVFVEQFVDLSRQPLLEAVENIYMMFGLNNVEGQGAYISAFIDQVSDFVNNTAGDMAAFIKEWDASLCSKTVQSDEIDGVRLISIHKSKGLEFDNVIIPFCDWAIESGDTTLWCRPGESPFNLIPIIPIDYSKKLLDTIYAPFYRDEHIQNNVDNLNLLYVAFTRAGRNLFVLGRREAPKGALGCRSELIARILPDIQTTLKDATLTEGYDNDKGCLTLQYGSLSVPTKNKIKADVSANVFMQPVIPIKIKVDSAPLTVSFKQSNSSRDFIEKSDNAEENNKYIKTGKVLHHLLSNINTINDVETVLARFVSEGILYGDGIEPDKLHKLLLSRFTNSRAAEWFLPKWKVNNECSILSINHETGKLMERRPDRVITDNETTIVIDFKFARPRQQYYEQVKEYMQLLKNMGCKTVKGYLWFVYTDIIEEVVLS